MSNVVPLPNYIVDNKFIPKEGFLSFPLVDNPRQMDVRFASTDTPELFEMNLKAQPNDWHYRKKEINYIINTNGYRAKEWHEINWSEAIVVLGCSMTAGIGVAEDETITHYLSLLSGREVVNLGVASMGIDGMLFNNIALKRHYKPWAVVNLWTNIDRMIEFLNNRPEFHGVWTKSKYFKEHNRSEVNPIIKDIFYSEAVKQMWKEHRVYYGTYYETTSHYLECDFLKHTNSARDLLHCGRNDNRQNARIIWDNLSRQK